MRKLLVLIAIPLIGCATSRQARSPLVYEDANVAIYNVCEDVLDNPFQHKRCHQQTVQKSKSDNVKADITMKTEAK